jgi:RimJ/RimL family protein N-acetyltransferase
MGLLTWFKALFSKEDRPVVPPKYPAEIRVPFEDPEIQKRLPGGYRIEFVTNSQSTLRFDPDHWLQGEYANLNLWDNRGVFSIEVLSQFGKPVAAVGWENYDPTMPAEKPDTVYTFGTFVAPHLRQRGLAKALWKAMIRTCGFPKVHGCAASDAGFTLLRSMKEEFPDIVSFDGDLPANLSRYADLRKDEAA